MMLDGKTAVVTGGSSGLGRAMALRFAAEGAGVVVADLRETPREGGRPTHREIQETTGAGATFVECDVTARADLESAIDAAEAFGGVDVMVNNAGIYRLQEFLDVEEADFDQMMGVNQKGVFFGSQAAANRMVDAGGGSIINMSSIAGIRGGAEMATYAMSKGAVKLLTYSLADELGPDGVRVNAIHPGIIRTSMTTEDEAHVDTEEGTERERQSIALRRIGSPEDVADVALFLASDLSGYVNGESIAVDGGMVNIE
jgi:NAD(P)-dependent dehydrogenase (short-subunit alcohol dehydrogenase family)